MKAITDHEFRGWLKLALALAALSVFFLFLFECSAATLPPLPPTPAVRVVKPSIVSSKPVKSEPLLSPKDSASKSGVAMVKPKKAVALRLWYQDAKGWHVTDAGFGIPEDKLTMRHWRVEVKPNAVRMVNTKTNDWLESNHPGADQFKWKLQAK